MSYYLNIKNFSEKNPKEQHKILCGAKDFKEAKSLLGCEFDDIMKLGNKQIKFINRNGGLSNINSQELLKIIHK